MLMIYQYGMFCNYFMG